MQRLDKQSNSFRLKNFIWRAALVSSTQGRRWPRLTLPTDAIPRKQTVPPLKSLTFGNGQLYSRTYDLDGRMASFTLNGQVQTVSYDAASRLTGIADAGNANNSRSYGYDQLDRLTSEQYPNSSRSYAFDAVGNRTQSTLNTSATNHTYAATSNRLATMGGNTVVMDLNGSTSSSSSNGTGIQFSYDARGRMVSANTLHVEAIIRNLSRR